MAIRDVEPESARELVPADPYSVASSIVLRQLSLAPKTRAQLAEKLAKKGASPEITAAVLDRFTELGYIDDLAYAHTFIRSKMATRHLSKRALAYELSKCGVDKATIEQALAEISDEDEMRAARDLVEKKLRTMNSLDLETRTRRIMGALARKGFSSSIATSVLRDCLNQSFD